MFEVYMNVDGENNLQYIGTFLLREDAIRFVNMYSKEFDLPRNCFFFACNDQFYGKKGND